MSTPEKCFCHFQGYKVKDADARAQISELSVKVNEEIPNRITEVENTVNEDIKKQIADLKISIQNDIIGALEGDY